MVHSISLTLYDRHERDLLNEALDKIAEYRLRNVAAPASPKAPEPAPAEVPASAPTEDVVEDISDEELRAVVQEYMNKAGGIPKAKEIMVKYGVEKVTAVPANLRPQFLREFAA